MNTPTIESLQQELSALRTQLSTALRERDEANQKGQERTMDIWLRCLGNQVYPKAHDIDALGKTTRLLTEDRNKALAEVATLGHQLAEEVKGIKALREDKRRLDWLEARGAEVGYNDGAGDGPSSYTVSWYSGNRNDRERHLATFTTLRAAIDAAGTGGAK